MTTRALAAVFAFLAFQGIGGRAAAFDDAAHRHVAVPASISRVMPAGSPADLLLLALAPDAMVGLVEPFRPTDNVPPALAKLPGVPRLTSKDADFAKVRQMKPDLIVDYGDLGPRYAAYADKVVATTGLPDIVLDGSLKATPASVRILATLLHREARGAIVAQAAEGALARLAPLDALPEAQRPRVYYGRGGDGLLAARSGTGVAEAIVLAGGRNVVPGGKGAFLPMTAKDVAALAPSVVVVADPAAAAPSSALRAALPASTRFLVDRGVPIRWMEGPPSLNRLLGARWLGAALHPNVAPFHREEAKRLHAALFGFEPPAAVLDAMMP